MYEKLLSPEKRRQGTHGAKKRNGTNVIPADGKVEPLNEATVDARWRAFFGESRGSAVSSVGAPRQHRYD